MPSSGAGYERIKDEEAEIELKSETDVKAASQSSSKPRKARSARSALETNLRRTTLFRFLRKARNKTVKNVQKGVEIAKTYREIFEEWNGGVLPMFSAWVLWMLVGTMYYAHAEFDGSYCKGFYFSINVGYSIGWGVLHEKRYYSKLFSIVYLLVGAIFVSRWLAYLIEHAVKDSANSYEDLVLRRKLEASLSVKGIWADIYIFFVINNSKLFVIYLWIVYIFFGMLWSLGAIGWTPSDALYFSISSMSTGGLQGVPKSSPDWIFLVVGLFASTGVPLMGMAVGNIGNFIFNARRMAQLEHVQSFEISADDYDLLQVVSNESNKTALNKGEFVLLCLAQQGLLDWQHLDSILKQFDELDSAEKGVVTFSVRPRPLHLQPNDILNPIFHSQSKSTDVQTPSESNRTIVTIREIALSCAPTPAPAPAPALSSASTPVDNSMESPV